MYGYVCEHTYVHPYAYQSSTCTMYVYRCAYRYAYGQLHTVGFKSGMIEHFHRQLKAALKAQPKLDAWMDSLPLILLGNQTSLKPDINSTAAEMVYGTNIRLPGKFFSACSLRFHHPVKNSLSFYSHCTTKMYLNPFEYSWRTFYSNSCACLSWHNPPATSAPLWWTLPCN